MPKEIEFSSLSNALMSGLASRAHDWFAWQITDFHLTDGRTMVELQVWLTEQKVKDLWLQQGLSSPSENLYGVFNTTQRSRGSHEKKTSKKSVFYLKKPSTFNIIDSRAWGGTACNFVVLRNSKGLQFQMECKTK